ncbi:MAG: hypothetical protein ACRDSR_22635 [Pseudonocardiaceae bacterium]
MAIAAVIPSDSGRNVDQTSHRLVCDVLRRAGPGVVEEVDSILYRLSAVLLMVLLDHPIDRRGRCRSCRRPGVMIGLRRRSSRPAESLVITGGMPWPR